MLARHKQRLRSLCHHLRMDNLEGLDEASMSTLRKEIKHLPSSETISKMSATELEGLRVRVQELQFAIDNSRNKRTQDYAVRNMVNKGLPPPRPPILASKNWYQIYKESSRSRYCFIYKAQNEKWYVELAEREYADRDDATTYGPFATEGSAREELEHHSNPGGLSVDSSGKLPVPTISPNGQRISPPSASMARRWF